MLPTRAKTVPLPSDPRRGRRVHRLALLLLLAVAGAPPVLAQPAPAVPSATAPDAQEAVALIRRANRLFGTGKKEDAVFAFYSGQLRFRAFLAAHPDIDPSGAPALFSSLMETVGRPINEYAFGDISALIRTIDRVLTWDEANPAPGIPAAARQSARAGLIGMRDQIRTEADSIRAERAAKGLENR
ncbi:hypothetical protein [Azorhizobium oxalatiphilum]|uniref:hypothetical protein n=1 Tax=Azorhizobium oxalatiphilum TaxID=980631 RepID=UPI001667AB9A|nr:hypothetical protein [Azorhizobium oxalatiphilum]